MMNDLKQEKKMTKYQCLCFWTVMWEYFEAIHQIFCFDPPDVLKRRIQQYREGLVIAIRDYSPDDSYKIVYQQKLEEWYYLKT